MKQVAMMVLLSVSIMAVASDGPHGIRALLHQNSVTTELDWHNKNLGNIDIEGLGVVVEHVKKLDLSDNSFSGEFPLTACLRAFPNLDTLTLNNNTRITGFAIDKDYKNNKLKVLSVENSGCERVPVSIFYKDFELETLDISESKQLMDMGLDDAIKDGDLLASRKALDIHLRNVVMSEKRLGDINIETNTMFGIRVVAYGGVSLIGHTLLWFCAGLYPCYCVQGPIPPFQYDGSSRNWANLAINSTLLALASWKLGGDYLGGAIARRCLPNGGKVTAVKYITNLSDEAV